MIRAMRAALIAAALCLPALRASAQSTATLRGIDVYRSRALTQDEARRRFGLLLREYVTLRNAHRPASDEKAESMRAAMEKEVSAIPRVAWARVHVTEYFTSTDRAMYAIFDVVDESDLSRLAFNPRPKSSLKDPSGLLALWRKYTDLGETLSRRGEMPLERPACPGFYCLWGGTPELDAMQAQFLEGVRKEGEALRRIVAEDSDGAKRAAALYVLSYGPRGADVVKACEEALSDPDSSVRGAALAILADIANNHPEVLIAIEKVLPRLDDPDFSNRGKAMGLLVPLCEKDMYRPSILKAAPRLVELLKLEHPESKALSYTVLSLVSKKNYDRREISAWEGWAKQAASGKP